MIDKLIVALLEGVFGKTGGQAPEPDPAEVQRRREEVRRFLEARRQAQNAGTPPPALPGTDSEQSPLPPMIPSARAQPPPIPDSPAPPRRPARPIPEPKPSSRPAAAAPPDWAARQHSIEKQLQSATPTTDIATRLLHKQLGEARRKASNARQDVADAGLTVKKKRLALGSRADIRRAMLLREVLGPCRALEPHGQQR